MFLASKNVHSVPKLLLSEKSFLVILMIHLFYDDALFYAFSFLYVFFRRLSGSSTFLVSDRRTLQWEFHCIRLSFCLRPFCWRLNKVGALSENRSCRKGFYLISCLHKSLLFQSQEGGCPCLCIKARIAGRIFFQLVVEKIVHQDLAVVKDRHPGVDRFVQKKLAFAHVDSDQVVRKFIMP